MLVLTRKKQERIQIGNDITITILRIQGRTVRVGIEAPRDIRVVRSELNFFDEPATETEETAEEQQQEQPAKPRVRGTLQDRLGQSREMRMSTSRGDQQGGCRNQLSSGSDRLRHPVIPAVRRGARMGPTLMQRLAART